jgi:RNA polymerase sigma factor (sigma-70 family)
MSALWDGVKRLCRKNVSGYVVRYGERMASLGLTADDLCQHCFFALMDAVKAFNPDKGYAFTTWLKYRIRNHMSKLLGYCNAKRSVRDDAMTLADSLDKPLSDEGGSHELTVADTIADEAASADFERAEDTLSAEAVRAELMWCMEILNDTQRGVLTGLYFEGVSTEKLFQRYALKSRGRVSQIKCDAELRLYKSKHHDRLKSLLHEDYIATMAYRGTGITAFRERGESVQERIVIRLDEMERRGKEIL